MDFGERYIIKTEKGYLYGIHGTTVLLVLDIKDAMVYSNPDTAEKVAAKICGTVDKLS